MVSCRKRNFAFQQFLEFLTIQPSLKRLLNFKAWACDNRYVYRYKAGSAKGRNLLNEFEQLQDAEAAGTPDEGN